MSSTDDVCEKLKISRGCRLQVIGNRIVFVSGGVLL